MSVHFDLIQMDSNAEEVSLRPHVENLIQTSLDCLSSIVNLIDIFVENQTQQLNLKNLGQLSLVS